MAKFKVGDKVTDGISVYLITGKDDGYYEWKVIRGKANPEYSAGGEFGWAEDKMRLANSVRSTNSVVAKALNSVGARNGHNAIRMTNAKFKPGDVVYCDYNQQVYAVLGSYDDKVSVKNLLNLETGSQTVREASLKEYPWKATDKSYPYYEKLAKKFAAR